MLYNIIMGAFWVAILFSVLFHFVIPTTEEVEEIGDEWQPYEKRKIKLLERKVHMRRKSTRR